MQFRAYQPNDIEAMYALDVICFEAPFRFTRRDMRRYAQSARARTVLAEDAGALAGFCIAHIERTSTGSAGYIVTLDVAPAYRRRGLARLLIAQVECLVAQAGGTAMALHVFTGNEAALRLYARNGYQLTGEDPGFYGVDADGHSVDALMYRKELSSSAQVKS